jgi:cytoskeleton protein RodZ
MSAVAPSPAHEGRTLRRARQRKHVTLAEAAEATRISERFLTALEREAPIEEFPAPVYARAFLKEYAAYLGLDPEKLVQAFDGRHEAEAEPQLVPAPAVPPPRRWPARAVAVISVVAVATIAALKLTTQESPTVPGPAPTGRLPVIGRGVPADAHHRSHPAPPRHIHVILKVTAACWVQATADGQAAFPARTLQPGEKEAFNAKKKAELILGNAGGVTLVVNGKRVKTGSSGQVAKLSFTRTVGKILRR